MREETQVTMCEATRTNGQPCTARALADGYCFAHSPALAQKRRAAYATGGRHKSRAARADKLLPASLRPVVVTLIAALDEVHAGTLEPRQASAMASVAGAIGRLYETATLEQRIEALEQAHDRHA